LGWTGANGAGYGDPLTRDPAAVLRDMRAGDLDLATARRVFGGELGVVERGGVPELFVSVTGRAVLGPVTENFKEHCAVLERPTSEVGPEYVSPVCRAGERMRYREFLCPVTGLRLDSEIVQHGEDMLHGVRLAVAQ
jgi:N-methylhydantoinase B